MGIVDTNTDPNLVDFPIPMNDDATKAIELVLGYIKEAVLEGQGKTAVKEENVKVKKTKKETK